MPRHVFLAVLLAAAPAHAQDCSAWIAEVWETEGGEAMTAHVCAPSGTGRDALLFVQCDGPEAYAVFYDDGGMGAPPGGDPDYTGAFAFVTDASRLTVEMSYQGLDGTYYATMPQGGVLEALFRSGAALTITPMEETILAHRFPAEGAGDALDLILSDCGG